MTRNRFVLAALTLASGIACAQQAPSPNALEKVTVRAVARFDFDAAELRPADRAALLAEVAQMKNVTWQAVIATGHTDSVGSDDYNQALAARRAEGVRRWLLSQGLDPALVRAQAQGETAPVADNASADGRAQNRRAELRFEGVRTAAR